MHLLKALVTEDTFIMQTTVTHRTLGATETPSFLSWLKGRFSQVPSRKAAQVRYLARGKMAHMRLSRNTRLACECGTVWITSDEGGPDIILTAGEEIQFARRTKVLVEAFQESRFTIGGLSPAKGRLF